MVKNGSAFEYQYAIADHQGNTRALFTSATPAPVATVATMETNPISGFENSGTNRVNAELFDHTDPGMDGTDYSQMLTGGSNAQVGVAKRIKVYPGDKVRIEAYGKYFGSSGSGNLSGFAAALLAAFNLPTPAGGETGTPSAGVNVWGSVVAGGNGKGNGSLPKAFVNMIVLDKHYKFLDYAWDGLSGGEQPAEEPNKMPHDKMEQEYTAKEEGWIYVYTSNENATLVDVYFDDVTVTHTKSNLIQYNEYYPFGMQTANSWTRESVTGNNFTGNGGSEMNASTGWYEMMFRNYDPTIGRMTGIDPLATKYASLSPYNYAFNDPVTYSDPSGAEPGMDPVYGYENSWRYDDNARVYDDVVFNRVIGWTPMRSSFVNSLDWMFAGAGEGPAGRVAALGGIAQFLQKARSSTYGGSWSDGNSHMFESNSEALAHGMAYQDRHNSWGETQYGSEAITILAYSLAQANGGVLPTHAELDYWANNFGKFWNRRQGAHSARRQPRVSGLTQIAYTQNDPDIISYVNPFSFNFNSAFDRHATYFNYSEVFGVLMSDLKFFDYLSIRLDKVSLSIRSNLDEAIIRRKLADSFDKARFRLFNEFEGRSIFGLMTDREGEVLFLQFLNENLQMHFPSPSTFARENHVLFGDIPASKILFYYLN